MPQDLSLVPQQARFFMDTRRNRIPVQDLAFNAAGQFQRVDLPQVGLLKDLWIYVVGTITTGTTSGGTFDANYWPYNLLASIALRSNEGLEIYRTSGYHNLIVQQLEHMSYNPAQLVPPTAFNDPNTGARGTLNYPTGARADSTVYKIGVLYRIPVAMDDALTGGLLLLQNQSTRAQLELQLGALTDWLGGSAALGTGGAISLTAKVSMEFFSVPEDPQSWPDLSFVNRTIEDSVAWTTVGEQSYPVPVGGVIYRLFSDWQNNGAPQAFVGAADPTTVNFGNVSIQYAGSNKPEIEDFRIYLNRTRRLYGQNLPAGIILNEFSRGNGSVEAPWSGRDTYNTAALTEFRVITNYSGSAPTNGRIWYVRQELQPRALG